MSMYLYFQNFHAINDMQQPSDGGHICRWDIQCQYRRNVGGISQLDVEQHEHKTHVSYTIRINVCFSKQIIGNVNTC